ncbi:hypothetical protein [Nostoc sp.]
MHWLVYTRLYPSPWVKKPQFFLSPRRRMRVCVAANSIHWGLNLYQYAWVKAKTFSHCFEKTFCPHPLTPSPNLGEGELENLLPSTKIGRGAGGEGETSKACQV